MEKESFREIRLLPEPVMLLSCGRRSERRKERAWRNLSASVLLIIDN